MKIMPHKTLIVSLAVLVGLGTCSLINGGPVLHTTDNQMTSAYVLTRNFPHRQLPVPPQIQQPQSKATNISLPANTHGSENWAGYIDTPSSGTTYTSVSGSWTVPRISASQENAVAAQWIGLGGVSSSDLLQMGTLEEIENGQPVAEVFWEQLPAPAQYVMTVPMGSIINASISPSKDSSSTWDLTFTVNGELQTKTISPVTLNSSYAQGIGTSAEWISEDPSNQNNELYPLANTDTTTFRSATVNNQSLSSSGNKVQPVALVSNNGSLLIAPSALGTDGESFSTSLLNTNTNSTSRHGQVGNSRSRSNWRPVRITISWGS